MSTPDTPPSQGSTPFPPHTPGNSIPVSSIITLPLPKDSVLSTACVLTAARTLRIESRILPPPPPGFLQLRIISTSLCGSDLHYWKHFRNGSIVPQSPLILGHESCAEVTAVGPPASTPAESETTQPPHNWKVGDLVALEVGVPCGKCHICLPVSRGGLERYNICPAMRFRSSGKVPPPDSPGGGLLEGTLQGGLNHPAAWCHPLPPGFNPYLASLLEPLSVAIHAMTRVLPIPETSIPPVIVVLGAGPVGLLIAACLKRLPLQHPPPKTPVPPVPASRKPKIVICDIVQSRLDFAVHEVGWADASILLTPSLLKLSHPDLATYISKRLMRALEPHVSFPRRVEAVFECTGVPSSLGLALHLTSSGGKIMVLTIPPAESTLALGMATLREVDIRGVFRYGPGDYARAIEVVREGRIRGLEKLVTHVVTGLKEVPRAMELLSKGVDEDGKDVVKVVVEGDPKNDFGVGCFKTEAWEGKVPQEVDNDNQTQNTKGEGELERVPEEDEEEES